MSDISFPSRLKCSSEFLGSIGKFSSNLTDERDSFVVQRIELLLAILLRSFLQARNLRRCNRAIPENLTLQIVKRLDALLIKSSFEILTPVHCINVRNGHFKLERHDALAESKILVSWRWSCVFNRRTLIFRRLLVATGNRSVTKNVSHCGHGIPRLPCSTSHHEKARGNDFILSRNSFLSVSTLNSDRGLVSKTCLSKLPAPGSFGLSSELLSDPSDDNRRNGSKASGNGGYPVSRIPLLKAGERRVTSRDYGHAESNTHEQGNCGNERRKPFGYRRPLLDIHPARPAAHTHPRCIHSVSGILA